MGPRQAHDLPHVVLFPFMAKGHTIPLLDFSIALSLKGLKVTILSTPANSPFILQSVSSHPNISVADLEFPAVDGLPKGCESTDRLPSMDLYVPFLRATRQLRRPFESFLRRLSDLGHLPLCVFSDFFLGWTLPVCRDFGVPRVVFHGMGAFSMSICKSTILHAPHKGLSTDSQPFRVPRLPPRLSLTAADLPVEVRDFDPTTNPICRFLVEIGETDVDSWGVVVNTSAELEPDFIAPFESFYRNGARAWCVGPMLLYNHDQDVMEKSHDHDECVAWLDRHTKGSVIYVSFGTQTHVTHAQLDEIAWGLEMSGSPFFWTVRSATWSPPKDMEERIKGRGLIIRDWAPQRSVLAHSSTGGFMSHCGWNSVLESLSMGVPLLGWPMIAEQRLNAMLVVDELGAGARIAPIGDAEGKEDVVGRAAICSGVKEIMGGENGRRVRERARELSQQLRLAVEQGGSSQNCLDELIKELISRAN